MALKVAVLGAAGRMGSETCAAVDGDPDLELVARIGRGDSLATIVDAAADVAVEFTTPGTAKNNIRFCIDNDIHCVVGTTGLDDADLRDIESWTSSSRANVFVAPNFAIGAVLMMEFAARAAKHFDAAEIIERHHEAKLDAPSGTALRTAALMNERRDAQWAGRATRSETVAGARGGDVDGVRLHSLRVPGSVAHQEVLLAAQGQTLSIRHDSIDRSSFMPGVLLAIREVPNRRGVTVGLEHLLEL